MSDVYRVVDCLHVVDPRGSSVLSCRDRSQIVFEVKPWDTETDLKGLFLKIREVRFFFFFFAIFVFFALLLVHSLHRILCGAPLNRLPRVCPDSVVPNFGNREYVGVFCVICTV